MSSDADSAHSLIQTSLVVDLLCLLVLILPTPSGCAEASTSIVSQEQSTKLTLALDLHPPSFTSQIQRSRSKSVQEARVGTGNSLTSNDDLSSDGAHSV